MRRGEVREGGREREKHTMYRMEVLFFVFWVFFANFSTVARF